MKTIATIALLGLLPACNLIHEEYREKEYVIEYRIETSKQYTYEDGTIEIEKYLHMKKNPNFKRM